MDPHDCKFEERIIEMSGDIKTLLAEFKNMNGRLLSTTLGFKKHDEESDKFRARVNILWYGLFYTGWIILATIIVKVLPIVLHLLIYGREEVILMIHDHTVFIKIRTTVIIPITLFVL